MKTLTAATLAALIAAGATYAIAQQGPGSGGGPSNWENRRAERMERYMRDELPALTDSRIAGLKGGLKLTPEQEKLWPPVEQALRDMAAQRAQMMQQRHGRRGQQADPMERLDRMVERSGQMNASLTKLRDAAKPLYATLDERQKRILPTLIRQGRHHMAGGWGGHGWGGRGEHRGMMEGMGERGWMGRGQGQGPQGGPNWGDGQPQRQ